MDGIFDDPGDLGFFDEKDVDLDTDELMENDDFYEPYPGEEELNRRSVRVNADGSGSFVGEVKLPW
jgi:hypothetical protein